MKCYPRISLNLVSTEKLAQVNAVLILAFESRDGIEFQTGIKHLRDREGHNTDMSCNKIYRKKCVSNWFSFFFFSKLFSRCVSVCYFLSKFRIQSCIAFSRKSNEEVKGGKNLSIKAEEVVKQKRIYLPKMSLKEFTRYTQQNPLLLSCMSTFYFLLLLLLPTWKTRIDMWEGIKANGHSFFGGMRERERKVRGEINVQQSKLSVSVEISLYASFFHQKFAGKKRNRKEGLCPNKKIDRPVNFLIYTHNRVKKPGTDMTFILLHSSLRLSSFCPLLSLFFLQGISRRDGRSNIRKEWNWVTWNFKTRSEIPFSVRNCDKIRQGMCWPDFLFRLISFPAFFCNFLWEESNRKVARVEWADFITSCSFSRLPWRQH